MHKFALFLPFTAAMLILAGCQSTGPQQGEVGYTLVHLRTGEKKPATQEASNQLFAGHFANMERMAKAGQLLVAGPYGKPSHADDLRGIFILDTADRDAAIKLAETDPPTQAGVFRLEYHDLVTAAPLRAFLATEMAMEAKLAQAGAKPKPGDMIRPYVLLTADQGDRAIAALTGQPAVLLLGRLDGTKAFAILDAEAPAEVAGKLGATMINLGPHVVDAWYASRNLAQLRELASR